MTQPSLFVTFEGIDGAGKSSHIEQVANLFRAQGRAVTLTREPGGTPLAEKLRAMVLSEAMDPLTEALLIFAARRDHIHHVISPALARGEVVLCDRFTDATFAYQGEGRGFDWETLTQLERWVQQQPAMPMLQPDLTLWFVVDPAIAAVRLAGTRVADRFESLPQEFFSRVQAGYARRQQAQPERFCLIDASRSMEDVGKQVTGHLLSRRLVQ